MPRQATTWLHASGYRYLARRLERALLGKDLSPVDGSRRMALPLGCALAVMALAGNAFLSLMWPHPGLGDARIVMGQASGALYVRVGDTWHPVLNLASARLIAAADDNPRPVPESELAHTKRGPLLGIPGAPQSLAPPLPTSESVWTICDGDGNAGTTVLVGPVADVSARRVGADRAILVSPGSGVPAYLLYRGRRAVVDLADRAVLRALRLQGQTPHIVSQALLNAVPEAPAVTAPRIRGAGTPAGEWLPGFRVGSVLRITRASGDEYYVVLGTGVQRIGQVAADLLRFSDSQGATAAIAAAPDLLRAAPVVNTLPLAGFPDQPPSDAGAATLCVTWVPATSGQADIGFLASSGPPTSMPSNSVTLAQADGRGPAVDAFSVPPGRSAYVAAQSLTGDGARVDTRYLVTDTGVRYAVHDDDAARALGLPARAAPAPWPVLAALPCGPELSREKASIARDTVPAGP